MPRRFKGPVPILRFLYFQNEASVSCSSGVISMQAWRSNYLFVIKGTTLPFYHQPHRSNQASKSSIAPISR